MSIATSSSIFRTNRVDSLGFYLNPFRMPLDLWRRRDLVWQFSVREVQGRYKGSYLGLVWAMITPLLMLAVFTFVFHGLFKARWDVGNPNENFMYYAMNLYSGIIAFNIFSESVNKSPTLITNNPNYVKKVVFPLEVLPVSLLGSALFHGMLSLVVLLAASAFGAVALHWTLLYLPLVCVPLVFLTAGLCWILASLGVFLRDIGHFISVVVQLLFFLTPITYPLEALKTIPWAMTFMRFNPLATIVENFRLVVNKGMAPDWRHLGLATAASAVVAVVGYAWFMKIKRAFADVI